MSIGRISGSGCTIEKRVKRSYDVLSALFDRLVAQFKSVRERWKFGRQVEYYSLTWGSVQTRCVKGLTTSPTTFDIYYMHSNISFIILKADFKC